MRRQAQAKAATGAISLLWFDKRQTIPFHGMPDPQSALGFGIGRKNVCDLIF